MSGLLTTNSIAFIGLCNEYCKALERAGESSRKEFIANMLRLLPRIYISASDLNAGESDYDSYMESSLDEDYYDSIRRDIESLMGPADIYLEVFEEDMKYSDTPIAASISECLADIFQALYNFLAMVKDSPEEFILSSIAAVKEEFGAYWGQTLCNVLRALNHLKYGGADSEDDY